MKSHNDNLISLIINMQEFDFKPKLDDAEDFYKKIEKKRAKLKEIN